MRLTAEVLGHCSCGNHVVFLSSFLPNPNSFADLHPFFFGLFGHRWNTRQAIKERFGMWVFTAHA